jgi:hypothetical protein
VRRRVGMSDYYGLCAGPVAVAVSRGQDAIKFTIPGKARTFQENDARNRGPSSSGNWTFCMSYLVLACTVHAAQACSQSRL